ncbi:hypothetical protein [Limimaricola sp.]|uniref:hypothetical protein n=1 Tax=Limimaricola sp. TaxID=2211665 RepID=UPI0025C1CA56|nr:hypothetical protein [Limimaricola sp.]
MIRPEMQSESGIRRSAADISKPLVYKAFTGGHAKKTGIPKTHVTYAKTTLADANATT